MHPTVPLPPVPPHLPTHRAPDHAAHGAALALVAALGICAGNIVWITLAASGAGILAEQYPNAFLCMKIAGLAFILWLAWSTATQPVSTHFEEDVSDVFGTGARKPARYGRLAALFFRGAGLQIANPNALVFFGGLLPAFFTLDQPVLPQALIMIATVTTTEIFGLTVYALGARALAHRFSDPVFARIFYICAAILMAGSVAWAMLSQWLGA